MAKLEKITQLGELNLDKVNMNHIQESYLRQIAHARPLTAAKKNKAAVVATGAKWFRQKGTGRARQGERTNPHMYGGGLAFPPHHRQPSKKLNKQVRVSALRSAVLAHVLGDSAYYISDAKFEAIDKTRDVAALLGTVEGRGDICLVLDRSSTAWRSSRNLPMVRLNTPSQLNVRDLVDSELLIFSKTALDEYKELLKIKNLPAEDTPVETSVAPVQADETTADQPADAPAEDTGGEE